MHLLSVAWWTLVLMSSPGSASTGAGIYYYGPEISENVACERAETLAKMDAIRQVVGENIYADEFQQCTERSTEQKCINNSAVYTMTDSYIRGLTVTSRKTDKFMDRQSCKVTVNVSVSNDRPDIDAFVDGRFFYKAGEQMQFNMKTNLPAKMYLFHLEGKKAVLIWPTFYGTNNTVANELVIPTEGYKIIARGSKNKYDESLIFVFSNEQLNFMREYNVEDLNNKLLSIKIKDRRIIRRNLVIEQ